MKLLCAATFPQRLQCQHAVIGTRTYVICIVLVACSVRSFLVERFEEMIHDEFGGKDYWDVSVPLCELSVYHVCVVGVLVCVCIVSCVHWKATCQVATPAIHTYLY